MGETRREINLGDTDDDQRRESEQEPFKPGQTNAPQPPPKPDDKNPDTSKPVR